MRTSTLIVALGLATGCSGLVAQAQDVAKPENEGAAVAAQDTQSWNGVLIDADCKTANASDKCEVTETTKTFGFQTAEGKCLNLDSTIPDEQDRHERIGAYPLIGGPAKTASC